MLEQNGFKAALIKWLALVPDFAKRFRQKMMIILLRFEQDRTVNARQILGDLLGLEPGCFEN